MVTPFLCSAADLQLIRAEHLPNAIVHRAAVKRQNNATAVVVEHVVRHGQFTTAVVH